MEIKPLHSREYFIFVDSGEIQRIRGVTGNYVNNMNVSNDI